MEDLKKLKATTNNAIERYHRILKEGSMRDRRVPTLRYSRPSGFGGMAISLKSSIT